MYACLSNLILLIFFTGCTHASLGMRNRLERDLSSDSDSVEQCVSEWENCLQQAPVLSRHVEESNFFRAIGSVPLDTSCSELKSYLTCSLSNVAGCASTPALQREVKNFAHLEVLRDTMCGAEKHSMQAILPCISSDGVIDELQQCSDIHITYTECDPPGFWTCVEFAMTQACGSEAESFLTRISDKLRVLDVGCQDIDG